MRWSDGLREECRTDNTSEALSCLKNHNEVVRTWWKEHNFIEPFSSCQQFRPCWCNSEVNIFWFALLSIFNYWAVLPQPTWDDHVSPFYGHSLPIFWWLLPLNFSTPSSRTQDSRDILNKVATEHKIQTNPSNEHIPDLESNWYNIISQYSLQGSNKTIASFWCCNWKMLKSGIFNSWNTWHKLMVNKLLLPSNRSRVHLFCMLSWSRLHYWHFSLYCM